MSTRMQTLTLPELTKIHQASMSILERSGVVFNDAECVEIFKSHGIKTEGKTVFPTEKQVMDAIALAPESFTVKSINPERNVRIGGEDFVLLPTYGPPFIIDPNGVQRPGLFSDYEKIVKLVATSDSVNMNAFLMVEPTDCSLSSAHIDMFLCALLGSDKPLMGTPLSRQAAKDCVELLKVAFGGADNLMDNPATVSLCNTLSPLQYSEEMAASLVEMVRAGQAVCIAALIMAGSSGPITIPGVAALFNAEALAGIMLAQLVRPGAPVIYGTSSSVMDAKTGLLSVGSPELSIFISFCTQLARFYKLPCRTGGGVGDSLCVDAQAGVESTFAIFNALNNGVNFMINSVGILGSYMYTSLEKFILDEEVGRMVRRMIKPVEITDDNLDVETIVKVGAGGHFLTEKKTFQLCRKELYQTSLMNRAPWAAWEKSGKQALNEVATQKVAERLASYTAPDFDLAWQKDILQKAVSLAQGNELKMTKLLK